MGAVKSSLTSIAARMALRFVHGPKLAVMTFHRVGGKFPIQVNHIKHHMELLARHFEVVAPSQAMRSPSGHPMAMVTIDDCHRDLYEHIYPVALSLKVPITICVPTDFFLRDQWLWFDQVAWMHEQCSAGKIVEIGQQRFDLGNPDSIVLLKRYLKRLTPLERGALIERILSEAGCTMPPAPVDGYEAVKQAEMHEMLASGLMEICAHTVTHTIATVLPTADFRRELTQSKTELEAFSGREVPSFCYPNGVVGDFDEQTTVAVQEAGFGMALTSVMGSNDMRVTDPFLIRRVHAHDNLAVFEKNISSLVDMKRRFLKSNEQ